MEQILEEFAAKYGDTKWINSHVSKGPIILTWKNGLWVITDHKTHDYHSVGYRDRYILTGGNWREREDTTPLDVYKRQLREELGETADFLLSVEPNPFADYLEFDSLAEHGDENLRDVLSVTQGDLYAFVSVFSLTVEGELVQEHLKIPSGELKPETLREKIKSSESHLTVLTLDDLRSGYLDNFGAGDGEKLRDYLQSLNIETPPVSIPRGKNYRLQSSPTIPYRERDTHRYLRVNPLEKDTRDPRSSFMKL